MNFASSASRNGRKDIRISMDLRGREHIFGEVSHNFSAASIPDPEESGNDSSILSLYL